jgi:hypothetical protein
MESYCILFLFLLLYILYFSRSVVIVHLWTKATEFDFVILHMYTLCTTSIHNFPGPVFPSCQKLTLGLLATTTTLEVVPSDSMSYSRRFFHFLNASLEVCPVRVFWIAW